MGRRKAIVDSCATIPLNAADRARLVALSNANGVSLAQTVRGLMRPGLARHYRRLVEAGLAQPLNAYTDTAETHI